MENYEIVRVKLTNTQLNKVKSAAKNKTGKTKINKMNKPSRWIIATRVISNNKPNNYDKKCLS